MRTIYNILSIVILMAVLASCVRKNDIAPEPTPLVGAKSDSGKNVLKITPRHHLKNMDSALVRISSGNYMQEKMVEMKDGRPIAQFDSLNPGPYTLYALSRDREINEWVWGTSEFYIVNDTNGRTYDVYLDVYIRGVNQK